MLLVAEILVSIRGWVKFIMTPPLIYIVLALAVAGGSYWWHTTAVKAAYDAGVKDTTDTYTNQLNALEERSERALLAQKTASDKINKTLTEKLEAAEAMKQKVKVIMKEVTKYVTPESDAACTIPDGFVRLHDAALADSPAEADRILAGSPGVSSDSPSTFSLSEVAATVGGNYAECVARGTVITAWQEWYTKNKKVFQDTLDTQSATPP